MEGYHFHLILPMETEIKSFIYNIVIVMPDIGSKIGASLFSSKIGQLLIYIKSVSLTRIQYSQAHGKKYCSEAGVNSCSRKLVVEIVSTDIVGTLKCFYSKCSQNPCRKNIPTRLVVEGFPQA